MLGIFEMEQEEVSDQERKQHQTGRQLLIHSGIHCQAVACAARQKSSRRKLRQIHMFGSERNRRTCFSHCQTSKGALARGRGLPAAVARDTRSQQTYKKASCIEKSLQLDTDKSCMFLGTDGERRTGCREVQ